MLARWLLAVCVAFSACSHAAEGPSAPQTIVHMLDYIGVDYPGAVENGRVKDDGEYKEMVDFTMQVHEQLKALPAQPQQPELIASAEALAKLVADKADAARVAELSAQLRWAIVGAYNLVVAPKRAPDLSRVTALYAQSCATCHGNDGRGEGPVSRGMDPAPANFHDTERMASRSVYGLYNTITLGVAGTAMTPFDRLSEEDRWALALYASNFGISPEQRTKGKTLWEAGEARSIFPDLTNLVTLSRNEVMARYGNNASLVQDYLRADPALAASTKPAPLAYARANLNAALQAYREKDSPHAQRLAVSAYLEGFELVEPALDALDRDLRDTIETDMLRLRTLMRAGVPASEVEAQITRLGQQLDRAEDRLGGAGLSPTTAAVSAFVMLLREGLEAILVVAALIAMLVKAGRRDALRYIHAGWVSALALGAVTWLAANHLVAVSGAGREITEGVTALLSTVMLLYVGYWLHDKSHARAWTLFIKEKLASALSSGTVWTLAGLSFLAVYREMFETVLFYQALWVQAGDGAHASVIVGLIAAAAVLAVIAWLILRYGVRLPIGLFFKVSAVFLALLAVAFAGQGVAALQEAGVIDATLINFTRIPTLGIFPTVQSLATQAIVLALIAAVLAWTRHSVRMNERA